MFSVKTVKKAGQGGLSWAKLQRELKAMRKAYVKAGVLGTASRPAAKSKSQGKGPPAKGGHPAAKPAPTNAQLASIHEYGLGTVPARPFIGPPFRKARAKYLARLVKAYKAALKSGKPALVERELGVIGQLMAADIKNYVTQGPGVPPPNSASTVARKGSSRPLVDTGGMVNAVTYQVVKP